MKGKVSGKMTRGGAAGKRKVGEGVAGKQTGQAMMFNHALGQHILKNPLIVQALVDKVREIFYLVCTRGFDNDR